MNWIKQIPNAPQIKTWSQAGEEGYISYILSHIGHGLRYLVDLGASDGKSNSNTKYFLESHGYEGLLIDGNNRKNQSVKEHWITKDNVVSILKKYNVPLGFTFLSLDLDGNDYDILKEVMHHFQPMLVVCEINGTIPEGISKKIRYNPEHKYKGDDYYGFSFSAAFLLAKETGYRVIFQNDALNVYMVRRDLLEEPDAEIPIPFQSNPYHAHNPHGEWVMLNETT
jgi:hypothetical protein